MRLRSSFNPWPAGPGTANMMDCGMDYNQNNLDNGYFTISASNDNTSGMYAVSLHNYNYGNGMGDATVIKDGGSGWELVGACKPARTGMRLPMSSSSFSRTRAQSVSYSARSLSTQRATGHHAFDRGRRSLVRHRQGHPASGMS